MKSQKPFWLFLFQSLACVDVGPDDGRCERSWCWGGGAISIIRRGSVEFGSFGMVSNMRGAGLIGGTVVFKCWWCWLLFCKWGFIVSLDCFSILCLAVGEAAKAAQFSKAQSSIIPYFTWSLNRRNICTVCYSINIMGEYKPCDKLCRKAVEDLTLTCHNFDDSSKSYDGSNLIS